MRLLRILPLLALFVFLRPAFAGSDLSGTYSGEQATDDDTLYCEISITKKGHDYAISGSTAMVSGRGAAPDFEGTGKVNAQGELVATFTDSFENTGIATIKPVSGGVSFSVRIKDVKESRCLRLYREITLKKQ